MNRWKLLTCACLLLALLTVMPVKTVRTLASSTANCGQWNVVSSPNLKVTNVLNSVTPVSINDVWAAGFELKELNLFISHWLNTGMG